MERQLKALYYSSITQALKLPLMTEGDLPQL